MPAEFLKSWFLEQRDFLLPESLKERFLKICDQWVLSPQDTWIERIALRHPELLRLFERLETMVERTTSTATLSAIDDELFFFYVLRVQCVWTHISRAPDEAPVPFDPTEQWWFLFGQQRPHVDGMADWTVLTLSLLRRLPNPPSVWRVPLPSDIEESMIL